MIDYFKEKLYILKLKWNHEWKYIPKDIKTGIKNIIRWFPFVWNDRDWDYSHLLKAMKKKLKFMAEQHSKTQRYVGWENNVKWMKIAEELCQRAIDESYEMEVMEYHDSNYDWIPLDDGSGHVKMVITINSENFDDYFEKYPREYEKIVEECSEFDPDDPEDKKCIAIRMSYNIQQKANSLLFKIISWKFRHWWD